jgi:hypothetical protein
MVSCNAMKQEEIDRRLARLSSEVDRDAGRRPRTEIEKAAPADRKSILASGLLSFFFGPLGWLYAGALREAVPGALAYILVCAILPRFLLVYLVGPLNALTALAGVLYAWSYNRSGRRETLLLKDPPALPPG